MQIQLRSETFLLRTLINEKTHPINNRINSPLLCHRPGVGGFIHLSNTDAMKDKIIEILTSYGVPSSINVKNDHKEMNREQIDKLAELYSKNTHDAFIVATICDEVIDKSGALLGRVRVVARKLITANNIKR